MTLSVLRHHARITLAWWLALFLFVLPGVLGSASSIVAVLGALALVPAVVGEGRLREVGFARTGAVFLAVFFALALAFAITARNPENVLYALNFMALPLALAVALAFVHRSLREIGQLLPVLCAMGAVLALMVAANDVFLLGKPRAVGFISGGNLLARVVLLLGALSLSGVLIDQTWRQYLYLGGFVAAFAAAFLTGSRGAIIAVPVILAVFGSFFVSMPGARSPWLHLAGLVAALMLTYVALGAVTGLDSLRFAGMFGIAREAVSGADISDSASGQRMAMLKAALDAFRAAPLFGHGWANLAATAAPHLGGELWFVGPTDPYFQFHNDLANFAVAAGVAGIVCWVALLIAPVAGALASPRDRLFRLRLYACLELSLSYLVFGLTDFTFGYDLPTTLYAFIVAVVLGAFRDVPTAATA